MNLQEWHEQARFFTEILGLETSPVALNRVLRQSADGPQTKTRICRAIMDAAAGRETWVCKDNNACFGAVWHLGFQKIREPEILKMTKKFVVEGEKLFSSYSALEKLIEQMGEAPDHIGTCFHLQPLESADTAPELVLIVCNPEQACRILTLVTFVDGIMPAIQIGGPTCRMAVIYPLLSGQVNISFYDYTARKICQVEKDKLLISIPAAKFPDVVDSIDKCTAGTAKIEYPQDFKNFLQKRQRVGKNKRGRSPKPQKEDAVHHPSITYLST